jgi:hypothetical protein
MREDRGRFWSRFFEGSCRAEREERVLDYAIHRLRAGARLEDVMAEPYVQRNRSPAEREEIITNPELVHAARERLEADFGSVNPPLRLHPQQ